MSLRECQNTGAAWAQADRLRVVGVCVSPVSCFTALLAILLFFIAASSSPRTGSDGEKDLDEIRLHESRIDGVTFSPDGRFAASAGSDGAMKFWEFATHRQGTVTISRISGFSGIAISPDGQTLASGTFDGRVVLADLQRGQAATSFRANEREGSVRVVLFSPDGGSLVTGGDDHAVHVWDLPSGRERLMMRGHDAMVRGLAFTPDGKTIVSISTDGRVASWDARTGELRERIEGGCGPLWSIAVSSDGRWAALGGSDGIGLRSLENGRSQIYRCSQTAFSSLGFMPGGTTLVSASLEGALTLWKVEGEALRPWRTLDSHAKSLKALAVSHDGGHLLAETDEGVLKRFRLID